MKKVVVLVTVLICILSCIFCVNSVYASNNEIISEQTKSELVTMKNT